MLSRARHLVARTITGGAIDECAEEALAAFRSPEGSAPDGLIATILDHTVSSVPFYEKLRPSVNALEDLPVVDKLTFQENGVDAFVSRHADKSKLVSRSTSGSTGVPFTVYMEPERAVRNRAVTVASLRLAGGDPFGSTVRAGAGAARSRLRQAVDSLKGDLIFSGRGLDVDSALAVARWINCKPGVIIQGYGSLIEHLLRVFDEHSVQLSEQAVSAIVTTAEAPSARCWELSQKVFGLSPHARYSNMEIGIMATTAGGERDRYKTDFSSLHVEVLKEGSSDPSPPGELGRIVVTDLHNRAMPMLRYDTGDLGRFEVSEHGELTPNVLVDVHGRRLDIVVAGTEELPRRVHQLAVTQAVTAMREIRQYQLRQHSIGNFTWSVIAERSPELEGRLRQLLEERVGDIESCSVEYVDSVPVLGSGKRRAFVTDIDDPMKYFSVE